MLWARGKDVAPAPNTPSSAVGCPQTTHLIGPCLFPLTEQIRESTLLAYAETKLVATAARTYALLKK